MSSKTTLRTGKRILSVMLVLMLSVCMVLAVTAQASAATTANDNVNKVKDSVLQVTMIYQPNNEDTAIVSSGTCFLINSTTALSCAHIFTFNDDFVAYAKATYGVDHKVDEKYIKSYQVLVNGGVPVNATLRKVNTNADYSIIKIDETIARPTVKLGLSGELSTTQEVYTLGYPDTVTSKKQSKVYSNDMITVTKSTITNLSSSNGVDIINHNAVMSNGNSGGPLVDIDGNVIGVNLIKEPGEEYYDAAGIDQITAVLRDLDIEYTPAGEVTTTPAEDTTAAPAEGTTAAAAVETTAAPATTEAVGSNDTDSGFDMTKLIIIIAIAVVVVIIIVVIIIIILSNKKKSAEKIAAPQRNTVMPGPGVPPQQQAAPRAPAPQQQPYQPPYRPAAPTAPSNEGAGETSVLNDGAGETTVLGNQAAGSTMMRKRNNEKISINKSEFLIGKERRRVDYCIGDNNSVSRVHAKITTRAGRCYISDMGSTNCTYVNGSKLSPNQEVILSKGDQIKISDEEFEFLG